MIAAIIAFFVAMTAVEIGVFILAVILFGGSFFKESGAMFVIGFGTLVFYYFKVDVSVWNIVGYMVIGFGWMIFKFRRHAYKVIERYKRKNINNKEEGVEKRYTDSEVKKKIFTDADADAVFYWWFVWPMSMITFVLKDLAKYIWENLKKMFNKMIDGMMIKAGFAETVKVEPSNNGGARIEE